MASDVNRLLVTNGIDVYGLQFEMTTLDSLFTEVIKTVKPWNTDQ